MAENVAPKKRTFRQLEQKLAIGAGIDATLYVLFLVASGFGIGWLKVVMAIACGVLSVLAVGFLVLIGEHKRRRSYWLLTAFAAVFVCMLVSLLLGYPSRAPVTPVG